MKLLTIYLKKLKKQIYVALFVTRYIATGPKTYLVGLLEF